MGEARITNVPSAHAARRGPRWGIPWKVREEGARRGNDERGGTQTEDEEGGPKKRFGGFYMS